AASSTRSAFVRPKRSAFASACAFDSARLRIFRACFSETTFTLSVIETVPPDRPHWPQPVDDQPVVFRNLLANVNRMLLIRAIVAQSLGGRDFSRCGGGYGRLLFLP